MDNMSYLFAANLFVWGGIFFYVATLKKRQQSLRKDLAQLKESVNKESSIQCPRRTLMRKVCCCSG